VLTGVLMNRGRDDDIGVERYCIRSLDLLCEHVTLLKWPRPKMRTASYCQILIYLEAPPHYAISSDVGGALRSVTGASRAAIWVDKITVACRH